MACAAVKISFAALTFLLCKQGSGVFSLAAASRFT